MAGAKSADRSQSKGQLAALFRISRALNSTLEVQDVLQTMLDMVLEIFKADAGSVMLENDGYLTISVSRGLESDIVESTRQKVGTGIAGWVALTGDPLHLDGKVQDERFLHLVERPESIASSLTVPITSDEAVVGVLMIRRAGPQTFGPGDLAFLLSVADLAAVALQKARFFQEERRQHRLLELGHQKLQATLSSMADGVLVFDQAGNLLTHNSVVSGYLEPVCGTALETFWPKYSKSLEQGDTELEIGKRILRIAVNPLVVEGEESGLVLLFRDETASHELEKMKSEFLSMISHELKTPITTISAFLELMLHREFERERQTNFLSICQQECRRLQSLIEQLLHLTRMEAGYFILEKGYHSLSQLIRQSIPAFAETNPNHVFCLPESLPEAIVFVDAVLMTQALTNLLSNAVKYGPAGGKIELDLKECSDTYLISVKDEGVGIESEKIKYVFEKFYRADNSLTRSTGGSGLGLANVKHIVLAHSGRVWVDSVLGQGSTFYLELPKGSGEN